MGRGGREYFYSNFAINSLVTLDESLLLSNRFLNKNQEVGLNQ